MIYELRMFSNDKKKARKTVIFTHYGCSGNPIGYSEDLMRGFDRFQLLERHFYGCESIRNYGYGVGYEPIIVGSI